MRGSLKKQIAAALACCTAIGASHHEYKQLYGGRSQFIHSLGTLDKAVHRRWPLQEWLKGQGIYDLESIDSDIIFRYISTACTIIFRQEMAEKPIKQSSRHWATLSEVSICFLGQNAQSLNSMTLKMQEKEVLFWLKNFHLGLAIM